MSAGYPGFPARCWNRRLKAAFTGRLESLPYAERLLVPLLTGWLCWGATIFAAESPYLVCVSNEKSGDITLIAGTNNAPLATIPVGKRPRGIHASPDGKLLYVALSGSESLGPRLGVSQQIDGVEEGHPEFDGIGVVDVAGQKFRGKFSGGPDPEQFALSPDGKQLYIANEDTSSASLINAADGKVEHVFAVKSEPEGVAFTPDGRQVYVTCETEGNVFVLDTHSHQVVTNFTVEPRPRNVAFTPDGARAFIPAETAGKVYVVDTATFKTLKVIPLPPKSKPMGVVMAPNGKKLYVSTGWGGTVCVIDTASLEVSRAIKVGARPWGLALSPEGKRLYAANGPSDDVSVVDLEAEKEITRIKVGQSPWGVVVVSPAAASAQPPPETRPR